MKKLKEIHNKGVEYYQKAVELVKAHTMPAAPVAEKVEENKSQ